MSLTFAQDSIIIDTDKVLDEIIHEEGTDDTDDAERIQWDRFEQHFDSLDESSLDEI